MPRGNWGYILIHAVSVHNLFDAYAGPDGTMDKQEFFDFWYHFDDNDDGNITKLEFDINWELAHLSDSKHSPTFFILLDRVVDEVLNDKDFPHIFTLFEGTDDDGLLDWHEFSSDWEAIFRVKD